MKKKIVFEFNDESITEGDEVEAQAIIALKDGRVILIPKSHLVVGCVPTTLHADAGRPWTCKCGYRNNGFHKICGGCKTPRG